VLVHDRTPKVVTAKVPNVIGLSRADAQATLGDYGFHSAVVIAHSHRLAGTVVSESPGHDTQVPKGTQVTITVSSGPAPPASGQVPNVINLNAVPATHQLHQAGFKVSTVKQSSTTIQRNTVISTNPQVGSTAPRGSTVVMTISSGPPRVAVPNVVDLTLAAAKFLLQQRGFVVNPIPQVSTSQPVGTVLAQTPSSGKAPQGSTVTLTVAKAPAPVTLPSLIGMTEAQASARLGKLGLVPSAEVVVRHRNKQYDGLVISQEPAAHTSVPVGSTVVIRVERYVAPVVPVGPSGPSGPTGTT